MMTLVCVQRTEKELVKMIHVLESVLSLRVVVLSHAGPTHQQDADRGL